MKLRSRTSARSAPAEPDTDQSFALVQTALPDYRVSVVDYIESRLGSAFRLYVGADYFDPTIQTDARLLRRWGSVHNRYFFGRRLAWQRLPRSAWSADTVMAELNPRVLSTWALLLMRRLRADRRTILWGHAWPKHGAQSRSEVVRHVQRRLATEIVAYTERQRAELEPRMAGMKVRAAPNAMYSRTTMRPAIGPLPTDFVYVGRLIAAKKPRLLVDSFIHAIEHLAPDVELVFVGDGPERRELEKASVRYPRIRFHGHVGDPNRLALIYSRAIASISPGYVGLSITQSLGFGVPMIIATDEDHSPEIEAAIDGENAMFFESDSRTALGQAMIEMAQRRTEWFQRRHDISSAASATYSVEAMGDQLVDAFRSAP